MLTATSDSFSISCAVVSADLSPRNDPLVEYEFEEIRAAIKFDREVASNVGWSSFVKTPGNRRRLRIMIAIAFFSQWSGNNLMYVAQFIAVSAMYSSDDVVHTVCNLRCELCDTLLTLVYADMNKIFDSIGSMFSPLYLSSD